MKKILFSSALKSVRRSPFQAIAAVIVFMITYLITSWMGVFSFASHNLLKYFESRPQIIAFLKSGAKTEDITALQNKLTGDSKIVNLRYVSREEAMGIYKKANSNNPLLSELVSPTVFQASFEFSLTDLNYTKEIIADIKNNKAVDEVGFTANLEGEGKIQDSVKKLKDIIYSLRLGGIIFVSILLLTSFLVLLVLISLRLNNKKQETEILGLIGASNSFVRIPLIFEAMIYSLLGMFFGTVITFVMYLYISPSLLLYFKGIDILPVDLAGTLIMFLSIIFFNLTTSFIVSLLGSVIAFSRNR